MGYKRKEVKLNISREDKVEGAKEVGNIFSSLLPIFNFFSMCISKLPLGILIIFETALIPTYIIIAIVSFVLSLLPIPILGTVPFFIFTVFETILAVLCGTLCVTSLLKAISVLMENKPKQEGYKLSKTIVSIILIAVSALYTLMLPIFMVLNVVDLVISFI